MQRIDDLIVADVEAGTGLALVNDAGQYLFILAGTRYCCEPGELFFSGVGGHRIPGESWDTCARREAREEIGVDIQIRSADTTWHLPCRGPERPVAVEDQPRPFAIYEMVHPPSSPRAGEVYPIVIFEATVEQPRFVLDSVEAGGLIALTRKQVALSPERRPTLAELVAEGAQALSLRPGVPDGARLYPIGTAIALARLLRRGALNAR